MTVVRSWQGGCCDDIIFSAAMPGCKENAHWRFVSPAVSGKGLLPDVICFSSAISTCAEAGQRQ
eukprot:10801656-Karenia_brevis.AAC.1